MAGHAGPARQWADGDQRVRHEHGPPLGVLNNRMGAELGVEVDGKVYLVERCNDGFLVAIDGAGSLAADVSVGRLGCAGGRGSVGCAAVELGRR